MKKCSRCKDFKDESKFDKRKRNKDDLCYECKTCKKTYRNPHKKEKKSYDKIRYKNNKREILAKIKIYRQTPKGKKATKKVGKKWRKNNPEKKKAHYILNYAVEIGKIIKPETCSKCGRTDCKIESHHISYAKGRELDVIWLCVPCHVKLHKFLIKKLRQ